MKNSNKIFEKLRGLDVSKRQHFKEPGKLKEMYVDNCKLLEYKAYSFASKCSADFSDCLSVANFLFVVACYEWEPEKSLFATFLNRKLETRMINHVRDTFTRTKLISQVPEDFNIENVIFSEASDSIDHLLDRADDVAAKLIKLVISQSNEIFSGNEEGKREHRSTLKSYLQNVGWNNWQIKCAFSKVDKLMQ